MAAPCAHECVRGPARNGQRGGRSVQSLASTVNIIAVAASLIAFGIVVGYAGLRLFAEYRMAFFANPRGVMTIDVLVEILTCGSVPVYLSVICLIAAIAFIFGGIGILVAETLHIFGRL